MSSPKKKKNSLIRTIHVKKEDRLIDIYSRTKNQVSRKGKIKLKKTMNKPLKEPHAQHERAKLRKFVIENTAPIEELKLPSNTKAARAAIGQANARAKMSAGRARFTKGALNRQNRTASGLPTSLKSELEKEVKDSMKDARKYKSKEYKRNLYRKAKSPENKRALALGLPIH